MAMTLEELPTELRKLAKDLRTSKTLPLMADKLMQLSRVAAAHLSARAKVWVTDEDVERAITAFMQAEGLAHRQMRAALESFAARLSQGAQVSVSDALNRLEDMAVAGEQLHGDDVWRFRALADRIAPQSEPDPIRDLMRNQKTPSAEDRALIANNMEFLVSQGAQSEPIYQCMCTDEDHLPHGPKNVWMDVDQHSYSVMSKRDDVRSRIVYTHPAERAAVPDGQASVAYNMIKKWGYPWLPCPICNGVEGCDHSYGERCHARLSNSITAAPQPPEGARVVPKYARLAYFALCEERAAYEDPLAHVDEAIAALIAEYGAEQLAAPTLAGKEGAK